MTRRTRKEQADVEAAIRPTTTQLYDALRSSTAATTRNELITSGLVGQVSVLTELTRESVKNSGRLVELSEERADRERQEFTARIEREKASQEALHRREELVIAASERRGAWLREKVGDRVLIPIGSSIATAIAGLLIWALTQLGAPTQNVTVEAPQPAPPASPAAPAPEPEPVPVPEPEPPPADKPRGAARDLMPFEVEP